MHSKTDTTAQFQSKAKHSLHARPSNKLLWFWLLVCWCGLWFFFISVCPTFSEMHLRVPMPLNPPTLSCYFQVVSSIFRSRHQVENSAAVPQHHHTHPDRQNRSRSEKSSHIAHLQVQNTEVRTSPYTSPRCAQALLTGSIQETRLTGQR